MVCVCTGGVLFIVTGLGKVVAKNWSSYTSVGNNVFRDLLFWTFVDESSPRSGIIFCGFLVGTIRKTRSKDSLDSNRDSIGDDVFSLRDLYSSTRSAKGVFPLACCGSLAMHRIRFFAHETYKQGIPFYG